MGNLDIFIQKLQSADENLEIATDSAACTSYVARNYSHIPAGVPKAIIYPVTAKQVEMIINLANECKTPLVVRSSQGDESYNGSSVPAAGKECVALNLSKMTKIMHIDTKNGTALIETGVTYKQLMDILKPLGFTVEHPLLPRNEKSVIASLLDRDPVMTPKHCWDIPDPLACVELIMGNGSLFRTGSAAGPGTLEEMLASGCAINQPQGPYCLDLARVMSGAQGTLAVVTWASVKIRPIGSVRKLVYVQTDDSAALAEYTSQIIRRRLGEKTLIVNRTLLGNLLSAETEAMPKWTLLVEAEGYHYFPEHYMNNQVDDMADLAKEYKLELKEDIPGICNKAVMEMLDSVSEKDNYWKVKESEKMLDTFFLSTLDKLELFTTLAEAAAVKFEIDPKEIGIYCQPVMMGRSAHMEYLIPVADDKRKELENIFGTAALDNKAFFSRPYGELTEKIYKKSVSQTPFMAHIKEFFDENRIMNPGKLEYDGGEK